MANRLFLGVPLTTDARQALQLKLERDFPGGLPGSPVPAVNWHLTLRFLGDVEKPVEARLRAEMGSGGLGWPFMISLAGIGAFPHPRRARVLWIGVVDGRELLLRLAGAVERRVRGCGLSAEDRPFSPHLTLSRVREPTDLRELLGGPDSTRIQESVSQVVLFRSHLGGTAPRYEVVERFPM